MFKAGQQWGNFVFLFCLYLTESVSKQGILKIFPIDWMNPELVPQCLFSLPFLCFVLLFIFTPVKIKCLQMVKKVITLNAFPYKKKSKII